MDECNPCPSVCHYTSWVCLCAVPQLWRAECLAVERVCVLGAFGAYPAILGKVRDPSLDTPYSWVAGHKLSLPHWVVVYRHFGCSFEDCCHFSM